MPKCYFCYGETQTERYHAKCCKKFFGIPILPEIVLDKRLLLKLAEQTINERIAITGVQPKLSVALKPDTEGNRLTIVGLWGNFILKPQHQGYSHMPENEDLTMHLAQHFKLSTCDHVLLPASDGTLVYIARRFDRNKGIKIHMEDFCQISGFQTEQKYDSSYENIGRLIRKHCSNMGLDIQTFFELLIFCFLTGNNDMHLKNFSVLHLNDEIILSPAYDLINATLINPLDKQDTALLLNGKDKHLTRRDFQMLGANLGIATNVIERTIKKFTNRSESVFELIESSFLPQSLKAEYKRIWDERSKRLGT